MAERDDLQQAVEKLTEAVTELKVEQASFRAEMTGLKETTGEIHKALLAERCAETTWLRTMVKGLIIVALSFGGVAGSLKLLSAFDTPAAQASQTTISAP